MNSVIAFAYLVASVLFIFGIKGLTHPRTAVRGNFLSAVGMLIAIIATFLLLKPDSAKIIAPAIILGSLIGAFLAIRTPMTAMPQMVALLNGFGGGASVLVAGATLFSPSIPVTSKQELIATGLSGLIGTVTFWGSLVAYAKLEELKGFKGTVSFFGQQFLNAVLVIAVIALTVWLAIEPSAHWTYIAIVALSTILGFTLVLPIGGADMPVVISLLNSYSGLAAAATGFVLNNTMLIITGSLVGASGIILTQIMCKAMNRSLTNVLFGKIDASKASASADSVYAGKIKSTSAAEIAMLLEDARRVVIVPGYGMAVAQAQHAVRDLYNLLEDRGVTVEFAIHPVAGRMPGHMNVLLAEVDIPYDKLVEMDAINPTMESVDVALIIGANDVVNPDARKPDSPIAGMPIIDVDKARTVIVMKRSLSPGFAGIPNPLFAFDNTLMYFSDGKKGVMDIVNELKEG